MEAVRGWMANPDELREAALDTEGMQTIRTPGGQRGLDARKIHAGDNPDYPQRESEWQVMNLIR